MEFWDVYDRNRKKTGKTHQRGKVLEKGEYHIVVHAKITNSRGETLMIKRHPNKTFPLLWEVPGGSILKDETSIQGAIREVKEEIGILLNKAHGLCVSSKRRERYHDFYDIWHFKEDFSLTSATLQKDEAIDIKWVSREELKMMDQKGLLIPDLLSVLI